LAKDLRDENTRPPTPQEWCAPTARATPRIRRATPVPLLSVCPGPTLGPPPFGSGSTFDLILLERELAQSQWESGWPADQWSAASRRMAAHVTARARDRAAVGARRWRHRRRGGDGRFAAWFDRLAFCLRSSWRMQHTSLSSCTTVRPKASSRPCVPLSDRRWAREASCTPSMAMWPS
jgi:hypothetical protein